MDPPVSEIDLMLAEKYQRSQQALQVAIAALKICSFDDDAGQCASEALKTIAVILGPGESGPKRWRRP